MKHKKRRNLRSRTTRQVGLDITLFIFIVAIMLSLLSFNLALTGFFSVGHPAGGVEWENKIAVTANSSQQDIIQHIVFGNNRPEICADGVRVETLDGQQVVFKTANEAYGEQGLCTETDVVFGNVIYQPPQAEQPPSRNFTLTGALAAQQQTITYNIYYGKIETQAPVENLTIPKAGTNETNISVPIEQPPEETRLFGTQGDAWWNSSFTCRKIINITNSGGTALTNYTVVMNISYLTGMQADFDDVRFVYNGTSQSEMYYQKMYITNSVAGQFAFLVPSIAANNNETVYMYYCNSSVTDGSNPTAIWNTYDPFDGASYNATRWETHYLGNGAGPENFTVSGGILDIYVSGQSPDEGSNTWQFVLNHTTYSKFDNLTICANISMVYSVFSKQYGILGAYQYESFTNRSYLYSGAWDANQFSNFIDGNNTAYSMLYTSTSAADFFPNNTWGTVCLLTNNKRGVVWINTTKKVDNSTVPYFPPTFLGGFAATASYRAATGITSDIHVKVDWVGLGRYSDNISASGPFNTDAPTHTNPILNSTSGNNLTTDNITCYNQTTYSPLNNTVTNIYNWYKNGTSLTVLNMPFDSDNSSSTNATKDYSGYNHNGNKSGVVWTSSGRVGGAYSFGGTNQIIDFGSTSLGLSNNMTISLWINATNLTNGSYYAFMSFGGYIAGGFIFQREGAANKLRLGWAGTDSYDGPVFTTVGSWAHLAVTVSSGVPQNFYVNGVATAAIRSSGVGTFSATDPKDLELGRRTDSATQYYNGTMDEVQIFNRTLSTTQVNQIYLDTKDGYSSSETITSNEISGGNTWMCQVTPSDGTQDGTTLNSSNLTIALSISACQTLSTASTTYNLNQSITGKDGANSWCLRASANNIIIDCHGYNVSANASGDNQLYGIYAGAGMTNITVQNCNVRDYATAQIAFVSVTGANNKIQNNTAYQFNASLQVSSYGLYLSGTTANTTIINNTVRNTSTADLFLSASGAGNVVKDTIIDGPYPAKINLTWGPYATAAINVIAAKSPAPADPATFTDIGRYVNVSNSSAAWAFLNISYTDADAVGVTKSSLRLSKNNGSWYTDPAAFASSSGNDSTNDYVWANITNFGSTFAPMGTSNGNISSCQTLSIANQIYNLTSNLTGNLSTGRCIDIAANNVTLDCAGWKITGSSSGTTYGVYVGAYNNTAIKNCVITNYTNGICLTSSNNSILTNNTASNNTNVGINLTSSKNNNLTNNTANNNTQYGIYLTLSSNNILTNNIASNNTNYGIWLNTSNTNNTLTNNTANYNNFGVHLASNSNNNTLTNNTANYNSNGFWLASIFNSTVSNNIASNNTNYGIYLEVCSGNNLTNNTANYNTLYGIIFVSNTNKSILINNTASYNVGWDFYSQSSAFNNTITNLTTNDTNSSFTYNGSIYLKSATGTGRTDPAGYTNISHYLNITNSSAAWIYLNVSYKDADVPAAIWNTSTIQIWKYSSGQWWNATYVGTPDSIDTTNKYVYANITNFSSIYTPLGEMLSVTACRSLASANQVYTLTNNLTGNQSTSRCIDVKANNVTLDCTGYGINGTFAGTTYGIYVGSYNSTTIKNCIVTNYTYGIYTTSSNLGNIINNTANNNTGYGIWLASSSSQNTLTNNTANNNTNYGITLDTSNNNTLTNNTATSNGLYGIFGFAALSSNLTNNTANSNTQYGIYLMNGANSNNLTNNTASYNTIWDFNSVGSSSNKITNLATNDTTSSFTYSGDFGIKSATGTGRTDPTAYTNISHYLNITNSSAAWIYLNVSYKDADVPAAIWNTSTLKIWKYSSGQWWNATYVGTPDTVDTTNKFVYANITNFSSIFAPLGSIAGGNVSGCRALRGGGTYNLTANLTGISDSSCLNITVGDVVLDCKGYSISANATGQNYGIYDSGVANVTIKNCNIKDYNQSQIYLNNVGSPNTIQNCTLYNSTNSILRGIWLAGTTAGTTITNDTVYAATQYDIQLDASGASNKITDTIIGSVNATSINLTYAGSVGIKAASFPATTGDYRRLGRTVDVTNLSSGSSAVLNVSYLTSDIPADVLEANLKMAKNNGSWYTDPTTFASSNGVDTGNHYVWANITTFGSQFGPLGISQNVSACRTINAAGTYNLTSNLSGAGQLCGGTPCCINIAVGGVVFDCKGFSIVASAPGQNLGVYSNSASTTVQNCDIADYAQAQIYFTGAMTSTIQNDAVHNSSRAIQRGIWLTGTGATTITGSTAYNAAQYDIELDSYLPGMPNTVRNTIIGKTYPTNINFDYGPAGAQIGILGVTAPTPDTAGLRNIHSYVDIVNTSAFAGTWGLLNISYTDAQAWGTDDYSPTFNIYKSSGGGPWQDPAYWAKASSWGSDPVNNYVWANITNFSSIYGPQGATGGTLTACPWITYPINMSGYWHLNNSLSDLLLNPCILINASNVVLDGQGYAVWSTPVYGLYADNGIQVIGGDTNILTNVTVENINPWVFMSTAITLQNVANSSVINTTTADCHNGSGNVVGIGLLYNVSNVNITNNTLAGCAGIEVGSYIYGNPSNVHDILVKNNTVYGTGPYSEISPGPTPISVTGASNVTVTNNNVSDYYSTGIYVTYGTYSARADNNLITNNTIRAACNIDNYTGPICFGITVQSNSTNITNNVINSSGTGITVIMPVSNYMFITNNTLYNNPVDFDIYSAASFSGSSNITATNNTLGKTYPTNINFTLGGTSNVGVLIATNCTAQNASCYMTFTQPADPFGFRNVSKYVEAFTSGDTWLALNISYSDSDLGYIDESSLVMAKHNATTWNTNTSSFANNFGVDTVKNIVYANITDGILGYPFAPLGPSCMNVTVADLAYTLTNNLTRNQSNGRCIDVQANNITLDCAGYGINGTSAGTTIGVYDNGYNNVTIKNCNIRNYTNGISLSTTNNSNFINNTLSSNTGSGFVVDHISNNTFANNTANSNPQYGIYLLFGNNDTLANNTFNSNSMGIRLESSGSSATNILTNNTFNSNTQYGVYFRICSNATLTNNNASLNSVWDFASEDVATNNKITNLTTNDTNSSFTYSGDIFLKSATGTGKTNPTDYTNISHYLNITNNTNAWIFLNVSYKASDIPSSISDNLTLKIWKYSSGQWWNSTYVGTPDTVDTTNKYVYANITNFSSIYAPMGSTAGVGNCMSLTAANSVYNLTTNLFGVQSGKSYCIDVAATNITLDCKGYSINGTTSGTTQGVANIYNNVTIKNCNVYNYTTGISLSGGLDNNIIINNTASSNTREGFYAALGSNNTLTNNTANSNTRYGFDIDASFSNNNLTINTAYNNGWYGIYIAYINSRYNLTFVNNTANSNSQVGIYLDQSNNITLSNNTANSNVNYGIFLYRSANNTLTSNTANNNSQGIYLYNSSNNNVTGNNASLNSVWDFLAESNSNSNTIINLTTNDTNSSFTYVGAIYLKSATGAGLTDPTTRYTNISHYLNITGPTWAYMNISYKDADVPAAIWNTSTIQIWKYSSGQWWNATYVGTPDSIDTTNKYVYANITNFSSIFAPLGGTNHLPNAPTLYYPADGSPTFSRKPYLNWTIPTDADGDTLHFQIQLANDSGFSQLVINQSSTIDTTGFNPVPPVAQGSGNESYKVQSNLDFRQFFWRVRAYDGYDWGSWSATFSFNVSKNTDCAFGQPLTSFGSTVIPGTAVNGTLNFADANNGTMYNISNTGNVNENITQLGTNMTCISGGCSGDYIDVSNMSWKSNITASNGTDMIYTNKIKMTATYDLANPVASNLPPYNISWYRQWLATRSNQGGGSYNGTYTQQCIES
jgi:parallel beta-helix repeat protein